MDFFQSVIMGAVQGLSEFLPISSSGHLVITSNLYKVFKGVEIIEESNQEVFLDIMLHLGTLIAVLIFFRKEIFEILKALYNGFRYKDYNNNNFKLGVYIILGTLITVLVAIPLHDVAHSLVFAPQKVGLLLVLTGFLLLFSEYYSQKRQEKKAVGLKESIIIAIVQGLAVLPGISRSGSTIAAGLICGNDRKSAAQFSFLLSIPIITGSSMLYPLVKLDLAEVMNYDWGIILAGTIVSAVVGYLCIKYFMAFISKFSLGVFGYYCLLVGFLTFMFFMKGV